MIEPIARTIKRFVAAGIGTQIYLRTYRTYRTELIFLRCGGSDIAVSTVSVSEDRENTNAWDVRYGFRVIKGSEQRESGADLILHMTEEALLRSIIPAVLLAGHGLPQAGVTDNLSELLAGVMTTLVAVNQRLGIERNTMFFYEDMDGFQDEVHLKRVAEDIS